MDNKKRQNKWIKKDDKVYVTSGNDKGVIGTVLSRTEDRIVIQGVNLRKKHMKRSGQNSQGGIMTVERPIHISNVRLCVDEEQAYKVRLKDDQEGRRLVYEKEGNEVVYRPIKGQPRG